VKTFSPGKVRAIVSLLEEELHGRLPEHHEAEHVTNQACPYSDARRGDAGVKLEWTTPSLRSAVIGKSRASFKKETLGHHKSDDGH
jgi:hypothetical protein